MQYFLSTVLYIFLFFFGIGAADAQTGKSVIVIQTAIESMDPFSGMKSEHTIEVDFSKQKIKNKFKTGTTDFFGVRLGSVRDNFKVKHSEFVQPDKVTLLIEGETASGVGIVPNINYSFKIVLNKDGGVKLTGCHDGYPSYSVTIDGAERYKYTHKSLELLNLLGECDIEI